MCPPLLAPLSPSTEALVTLLTSWRTLSERWRGDGDTISILEQIGAAGEPRAIPALMSFGLVSNPDVRSRARSSIYRLFSLIPMEALPTLDESLRPSFRYLNEWYGMKVDPIENLSRDTDADRLYLALVSCHRSGFVRAEALRVLGKSSSELIIPFALMRLVDWVRPVATVAEVELRRRLNSAYADTFIDCLGLVERLAGNSRYRAEYSQWIDEFLKDAACASALQRGMRFPSRAVRRRCFRIALENPAVSNDVILRQALTDADVIIRHWAFTVAPAILNPEENERLILRAAGDPYGPIRRVAFDWVAASPLSTEADFETYLLDRSTVIRWECQSLLSKRFAQSPAEFYRALIRSPTARRTEIAVLGLAETGDRTDTSLIVAVLTSRSARVRRSAIRALRVLGVMGLEQTLLQVVSLDIPSVVREAVSTLLQGRKVAAEAIWSAALTNVDHRIRILVLKRLTDAGKWQQISIYLQAAAFTEASVLECAIGMLEGWMRNFNRSFAQPAVADANASLLMLESVRERLPRALANQLGFTLRAFPN